MEKKYKVLLLAGGRMGEIAHNVLETHPNVDLVEVVEGSYPVPVDIIFSASYPSKVSQSVCANATIAAVNIHTGLLPEGRGSHPLNWALIWGKEKTGITIHKITDTYDAGDICVQHEVPIFETDTIVELRQRVEDLFPNVVASFFDDPERFIAEAWQQNQAHTSYAQKRLPEDGLINEKATPQEICNFVRAHDPNVYPAFIIRDGLKQYVRGATIGMVNGKEECIFAL